VIVVTSASKVSAWHSDGSQVTGFPKSISLWETSPEIGDIDGDGSNEIVVSSNDSHVYSWKGDGTDVSGFPVSVSKISYSSPAIGDVNGDSRNEVVVGSDSALVYAIKGDGTILPGWPQPTAGSVRSKPALADLDKDGILDIISGSNGVTIPSEGGMLYAWRSDGTPLLSRIIDDVWWVESSPAAADIDADGDIEVAIGNDNTNLYVVKVQALVPPVAGISSPAEGAVYAVGDAVIFNSSSTDDGTITSYQWSSSISGTIGTTSSFTTSALTPGVHVIMLTVTDNDGLTNSTSVTVRINSPPAVSILSPASGSVHTMGTQVAFTGSASDSDGSIASYEWTSDINGLLSTASTFSTSSLAAGSHNIIFRAVDNDGANSTAQILIRINIPPLVSILSPLDGSTFKQSDTVFFNGSAADSDGSLVSYLWTSDIDGVLGSAANFTNRSLSSGLHVISFTATDNDGAARSAQVKVTIGKDKGKYNSGGGLGSGGTGTGGLDSGGTGTGGLDSGGTGTGGLGSGGAGTGVSSSGGKGGGEGSRANDENNVVFAETSKSRYVQKGSPTVFTFSNESNPVINITILTRTTIGDVSTIVQVLRHAPQSVESVPAGVVERYFSVYVGQAEDVTEDTIENATIEFRVPRAWLDSYDIDRSTVRLGRYVNGDWNSLVAELLGEDNAFVYFRTETPGLSSFVVTGRARQTVQNAGAVTQAQDTQTPEASSTQKAAEIPAFELLAAVAAIAIAFVIRTKKR